MTEQEWLTSTDPAAMLQLLGIPQRHISEAQKVSDRKLQLLAQHLMGPIYGAEPTGGGYPASPFHWLGGWFSAAESGGSPASDEKAIRAALFRDVFGNPFRRPMCNPIGTCEETGKTIYGEGIDPAWLVWRGGIIPAMAKAIYEGSRFEELAILADALEEAGCTDEDILSHCRADEIIPCPTGCKKVNGTYRVDGVICPSCHGSSGGVVFPAMHVRGCWVIDLLLGKE